MKRVCIIEPVFTHYRLPVYEQLSRFCHVDWVFSPSTTISGFGEAPPTGASGLRFVQVPDWKPFGGRFGMFQRGVAKYVLRERPDAILVSSNLRSLSFWTTLILARLRGTPVYVHGHGLYKKRRIRFLHRTLIRIMLQLSCGYIAYAPIARESFPAHGFSDEKVMVAHNTLVNPFPVRPEEKTGSERGVLFLGRLRRGCRVNLLIRVIKRLREEESIPLTLNIVGSGEEEESLRQEAASLSWITWHGEVHDLLQIRKISLDCFVGCYPGNAGLSVVHLLSLSLPVVINDDFSDQGPETSFVQNGVNGLVYDHTNSQEFLYRELKSLAGDPRRIAKMQRSALEEYQTLINPPLAERLFSILGEGTAGTKASCSVVRP